MSVRRSVVWVTSFSGATTLALLGATQGYASRLIEGLPANWFRLFRADAINWYVWAALAPLVFELITRARRPDAVRPALMSALAIGSVLFAHSVLEVVIARAAGIVPMRMPFLTNLFARFTSTLAANLIILGFIVLAVLAVKHYREIRERQIREADLRAALADAQLRALRMQLQPHFLFNTLHTASGLMDQDVSRARRVLTRLGDLLRTTLSLAEVQEVSLRDELSFLGAYLEIQSARFEDRLAVELDIDQTALVAAVPTLLLQPIVENAIKHAIEPRSDPGWVRIRAIRAGHELHLEVSDSGRGRASPPERPVNLGIGLANTRARLEQLYGPHQCFNVVAVAAAGLIVRIKLPFREYDAFEPPPQSAVP